MMIYCDSIIWALFRTKADPYLNLVSTSLISKTGYHFASLNFFLYIFSRCFRLQFLAYASSDFFLLPTSIHVHVEPKKNNIILF